MGKKLGFFIGHTHYLPQARALCDSIMRHTALAEQYQLIAMVPTHLSLTPAIPGVETGTFTITEAERRIPFIDKMLAAAAWEQQCDAGYMWLDVDSYFLRRPVFPVGGAVYANPVDQRNIGDLYGAAHSPVWRLLYDYFQLDQEPPAMLTSVSREKIYAYFNAGMVVVNENKQLFTRVAAAIHDLLPRAEIQDLLTASPMQAVFWHQAVFSCALLKLYAGRIQPLPRGLNYPLHLHSQNTAPLPLHQIISLRYDDYFVGHRVPAEWQALFTHDAKELKPYWYYREG